MVVALEAPHVAVEIAGAAIDRRFGDHPCQVAVHPQIVGGAVGILVIARQWRLRQQTLCQIAAKLLTQIAGIGVADRFRRVL